MALFSLLLLAALADEVGRRRLLLTLVTLAAVRSAFGLVRYAWFGGDSANPYRNFEGLDIRLVYFDIGDNYIAALAAFCIAWLLLMPGVRLTLWRRSWLLALLAMGVHSTFFGPIKYAILPQHLHEDEVLAGTGLVEAGTYIAILAGTILAGWIPVEWAAAGVVLTAVIGYITSRYVPPAPPQTAEQPLDFHLWRSSIALIKYTMKDQRVFLAIMAISFFWTVGTVLFIQFPPLAKNVLSASKEVASLFLVIFSIGVAIGSVSVNALLRGTVSARYSPVSVIVMGLFVIAFWWVCHSWYAHPQDGLLDTAAFLREPLAIPLLLSLLGISVAGGMFVVPLYAFLTTFVDKSETARTIAANNIVNSGAMVFGSVVALGMSAAGVAMVDQLLLGAAMCLFSAWLGRKLVAAEAEAAVR